MTQPIDLTFEQWEQLVAHRGGCWCSFSTHPPCVNCGTGCSQAEAEELGFVKPAEPENEYMKAVRDMCR